MKGGVSFLLGAKIPSLVLKQSDKERAIGGNQATPSLESSTTFNEVLQKKASYARSFVFMVLVTYKHNVHCREKDMEAFWPFTTLYH